MTDYITLAEMKQYLRMDTEEADADDDLITLAIGAAENTINTYCNRVFVEPVPDTVKLATMIQASRLYHRRNSPFGIAGSVEMGSELRLFNKVDPDVAVLLSTERNHWSAV